MKLIDIPSSLLDTRLLNIDSSLEMAKVITLTSSKKGVTKQEELKTEVKKSKHQMPDEGHSFIKPKDNDPL